MNNLYIMRGMNFMIELLIQNYNDREKMIMSLVNSGYTVKLIEKPDPKKHSGKLHYVQITDGSPIEKYEKVKNLFAEYVRRASEAQTESAVRAFYNGYVKGIQEIVEVLIPELELDPEREVIANAKTNCSDWF